MPSTMPSTMCLHSLIVTFFSCLWFQSIAMVWAEQQVVAGLTITSAPCVWPSILPRLQRRDTTDSACSWGSCAGTCLDQGAFCCNPGGTSLTPNWICDNGACITSVRGDTGVVDCYDPDNPSGTTQSCIDFVPTTTCFSTDRCYTCESDVPYCHWQTWIASNSPTLRWFSCISSREGDETFLAATITGATSSTSSSASTSTSATSSTPTTSASPTPTTSIPSSTSLSTTASASSPSSVTSITGAPVASSSSPVLSTGAIAGIAVGGAALLIFILAFLIYCFRRRRNAAVQQQEQRNSSRPNISHPSPIVELSTPTYYPNSLAGSGSQGTDEQYWRYHSHPNLVGGEDRFKTRMPIELPVPPLPPTTDIDMSERRRGN